MKSEEVTFLGLDEYQLNKHLGDLGNLLEGSNDDDRLQAHTERIRIQKYLREKLLPPQQLFWPYLCEEDF